MRPGFQDNDAGDGRSNAYPVRIEDLPGVIVDGGTILGDIDQNGDWRTVYSEGNSAGVRTENTPNVVIRDWRISDTWDAVRVSWNSPDFLIEDVWVTNARDDAVENDRLQSGTIRDSLFDGAFAGLSIDPSSSSPVDGHDETVLLDGVLLRLQRSSYEGEFTHASPIKTDSATDGAVTPSLRFVNCVFAIEDVEHHSYRSMFDAWAHTVESKGNVFLNLSDTPLPDDYPVPPAGWTVLQGQAARDYWEQARDEWIARHGEDGGQPGTTDEETPASTGDGGPAAAGDDDVAVPDDQPPATDGDQPPAADEEEQPTTDGDQPPAADEEEQPATDGDQPPAADEEEQPATDGDQPPAADEEEQPATEEPPAAPDDEQPATEYDPSEEGDDTPAGAGGERPGGSDDVATFDGVRFEGDDGDDLIIGNALDNFIDGDNGDDTLMGGAGNDTIRGDDGVDALWGGDGADVFFFKRESDLRESRGIDTIHDFTEGDKIDLSSIDANRDIRGDQAFFLVEGGITGTPGQLTISYDADTDYTTVSASPDTDTDVELTILLVGNIALSETDFIL